MEVKYGFDEPRGSLHGTGPGCFIEVRNLLPLWTKESGDDSQPTFDVIAPSLPNFGFSEGVTKVSPWESLRPRMRSYGQTERVWTGTVRGSDACRDAYSRLLGVWLVCASISSFIRN